MGKRTSEWRIQAASLCLPRQLFLETLVDFWNKLSDRAFWANPKAQDIAIEALGQDYLRTEHGKHLDKDAVALQAALQEYRNRQRFMSSPTNGEGE